jgi:hypothetical protein
MHTSQFSQIRAIMYFDSQNSGYAFTPPNENSKVPCVWTFGTSPVGQDSISGLSAFSNLANDPLFSATVTEP